MTRTRAAVVVVGVAIAAALGGGALLRRSASSPTSPAATSARYQCPMHPTIVSDRPGECPICHMTLVPVAARSGKTIYRSTMNPSEVADKPGKDSMGMEMVRVESESETVSGLATVRIPEERRRLLGVKTSEVARRPFVRTIRAPGRVAPDETRLREVRTKVAGYVEALFAGATGETLRRGEPLLSIYSPELLASQQEYLVALETRQRTAGSSIPSIAASGEEVVASARRRLELLDLADDQLRALETTGQPQRTVTLHAPISGTVLERMVTQGQRVEPETPLLKLADLSRVWVLASVFEHESPFVRVGQRAEIRLAQAPTPLAGRIGFVYPVLDATTRSLQVRIELDNPGRTLKPEMFVDVGLEADLGTRLAVPASAVMETGTRQVVFVDKGDGRFEPREVRTGLRLPDVYEILDGLSEGERVVTSANFFIDSESKLESAMAAP